MLYRVLLQRSTVTKSVLKEGQLIAKCLSTAVLGSGHFDRLNFVDGQKCAPVDLQSCDLSPDIAPRSGEILGEFRFSNSSEVNGAVESAKMGHNIWKEMPDFERGRIMTRAAEMLRAKKEEIARIDAFDTGRVLWECEYDVEAAAECLEYYAGVMHTILGQTYPFPGPSFSYTRRESLGVCAGIGAWNFPFLNIAWKCSPAICCGNSVVYKPSPLTPLSSVLFAETLHQAGLPSGVLNIVQGGAEVGNLLCQHDDIAKVSFTGSAATGTKVMQSCAEKIKNVTLELGGKSPLVIFADADMENALKGALMANYLTQGEVCSNAARVFVEESIFDEFLEKIVKKVQGIRVGDPLDTNSQMGAIISEDHLQKVLAYVDGAKNEGATILCGGERIHPKEADIAGGFYMSPCVMTDCHDDMTIVKEEHFGPIMSVLKFKSEEEVIHRANNTKYGLSGGAFTSNMARAYRFISKLQAGACYINNYNVYPIQLPFGGYKMSGIGRENGLAVLEGYSQLKSVFIHNEDVDCPF